jgi:hypothetical protein
MNKNKTTEKSNFFKPISEYQNLKNVMITNDEQKDKEATDEILTNLAVIAQITIEATAVTWSTKRRTPAVVPTPLPPRKPSHTGYTCPITQHKPASMAVSISLRMLTDKINRNPLRTSDIRVIKASLLLPQILRTFVVPVLCDPPLLTSTPLNSLE